MTTITIALKRGFGILFVPRPSPWLSHVPKCYNDQTTVHSFVNFYTAFPPVFHIEFRGETSKKMCMEYWVPLPPCKEQIL
jgi:hypothetical protein